MPTFDATAGADLIAELTAISIVAATTILAARGSGSVRVKADGSPVTNADEAADAVIRERLARLATGSASHLRGTSRAEQDARAG